MTVSEREASRCGTPNCFPDDEEGAGCRRSFRFCSFLFCSFLFFYFGHFGHFPQVAETPRVVGREVGRRADERNENVFYWQVGRLGPTNVLAER